MSEFVEVMRQFNRMCKANAGCFNCPLHEPDGVSDRCSIGAFVNNPERIEREVMQWAAEHPVVYPTWGKWLQEIGVAQVGSGMLSIHPAIAEQPIPASFAQEHGIEPKGE